MFLSRLLDRIRRDDRGFSMVVTVGAMALIMASAAASVSVVASDQPIARDDLDRKRAFVVTESALQIYVRRLLDNNDYWRTCENTAQAVNRPWDGNGADPRTWATLPTGEGMYTFEALPVDPNIPCNTASETTAIATMLTPNDLTYRIRVTGQAIGPTGQRIGTQRAIIATFSRVGFLDFAYLTDFESQDPVTYPSDLAQGQPTRQLPLTNPRKSIADWGQEVCAQYAYTNNRRAQRFNGQIYRRGRLLLWQVGGTKWRSFASQPCGEMQFRQEGTINGLPVGEIVNGPMHLNDQPMICGSPRFGRRPEDRIEVSAPNRSPGSFSQSYVVSSESGCGGTPNVNRDGVSVQNNRGTWIHNSPRLQLPSTNKKLQAKADPAYVFNGETFIELAGNQMRITNPRGNAVGTTFNNTTVNFPPNGIVYVRNTQCAGISQVADPQRPRPNCGTVWLKGTYNSPLTIAAEDDVRINGNIINNVSDPRTVLGVIANNFIRIHHPIARRRTFGSNRPLDHSQAEGQRLCRAGDVGNTVSIYNDWPNASDPNGPTVNNIRVDGAFLALNHSFLVDNWRCGNKGLGTLTINGAVSQKHRGPTNSRSSPTWLWEWFLDWLFARDREHGYTRTVYNYNDNLRLHNPPAFLDPIDAGWRVKTYQEQVPAPGARAQRNYR